MFNQTLVLIKMVFWQNFKTRATLRKGHEITLQQGVFKLGTQMTMPITVTLEYKTRRSHNVIKLGQDILDNKIC